MADIHEVEVRLSLIDHAHRLSCLRLSHASKQLNSQIWNHGENFRAAAEW